MDPLRGNSTWQCSHPYVRDFRRQVMEATPDFTEATNDPTRPLGRAIDQAGASVHGTIDKVSNAARPAVDRLASGAHQTVDKIAGAAGQAVETFGIKGKQLSDAQARLAEATRNYVRDNPAVAIGIAIAAGFLLSRVLSSR
jgi:ElaB/YqjD/DUF883 family membrane-anchored ribosome-binding protein